MVTILMMFRIKGLKTLRVPGAPPTCFRSQAVPRPGDRRQDLTDTVNSG